MFDGDQLPLDEEEIRVHVANYGLSGLDKLLQEKLNSWKEIPVNIGVTGSSGAGKSSFINAVREMDASDDGGAPVGAMETTIKPTPYVHPSNKQIVWWDLPGVGTPRFPQSTYLESVQFERYDCFILLSNDRFTENDLWLATAISKPGKNFYFVRSKIDDTIRSQKRAYRKKTIDEDELFKTIKDTYSDQFKKADLESHPVYLIDNYEPQKYEFDVLMSDIIRDQPVVKREALALSLTRMTDRVISEKKKILEGRIWKVATASAIGGLVPIPGLSFCVDVGLIVTETKAYRQHFGLDDASLEALAKSTGISIENLQRHIRLQKAQDLFTTNGIIGFVSRCSTLVITEEIVHYIPIIGSAVAGGISFYTTRKVLHEILDILESDARSILKLTMSTAV